MSFEQSKAAKRRFNIGAFHRRYFVGHGIDIGGKPDPLKGYEGVFSLMMSCRTWDLEDGDAQFMKGVADNSYDFVHSSHCLEHMVDAREALKNWIRIVKPGGHLIITVPDEDMYEAGKWPPQKNTDHKWSFTIYKQRSWCPKSINVLDLCIEMSDLVGVEKVEVVKDFYRPWVGGEDFDQSSIYTAECSIEFVLRKHDAP